MNGVAYPATCTKASWDREKGVIAKAFHGETGIGKAAEAAEAASKKIDWSAFDGAAGAALPTAAGMQAFIAEMKADYAKMILPARDAALNLSKVASTAAAKFKANSGIPKSSREYAEKVMKDSSLFATLLKSAPEPELKKVEAAFAKKAVIPQLKAQVAAGGLPAVLANVKVTAAFRDFLVSEHADDQLDAYLAVKTNPQGKKAVDYYKNYIMEGAKIQANVSAELRKIFDDAYGRYVITLDEAVMNGLPWLQVATKISREMLDPVASGTFTNKFDKFFAKYI